MGKSMDDFDKAQQFLIDSEFVYGAASHKGWFAVLHGSKVYKEQKGAPGGHAI